MLIYNADYDTLKTKYGFHKGYRKASENKYYVGVNEDDCIQVYENGYMKVGNIVFTEQKELYCHHDANVLRDMFLDGVLKYMKEPTTETIHNNDKNDHRQLKVEDANQRELISHDTAKLSVQSLYDPSNRNNEKHCLELDNYITQREKFEKDFIRYFVLNNKPIEDLTMTEREERLLLFCKIENIQKELELSEK